MRVTPVLILLTLLGCSTEAGHAHDAVGSVVSALDTTHTGVWKVRDHGNASFQDHARLVYHASMAKVLLVSARPNRGVFGWDGSQWLHVADSSSALYMQGATYDEARARIVLFGGLEADHVGAGSSRGTWFWQSGAWEQKMLAGPAAGGGASLTYDATRRQLVLTGGASHTNGTLRNETWLSDGEAWTKAAVAESPASQYAGAAHDRARELLVLVRPITGGASETWEWNGSAWSRIAAATPLPYEYSYSLAYDETNKRVVSVVEGALWAWSGSTWARVDSSDGREVERKRATIGYDAARKRLVVRNTSSTTWETDGTTWYALPPRRPNPRNDAASTYDSARRRVIFFGSTTEPEDATWEWDGASWTRGPSVPSAPPTGLALAYDSKRARAVTVVADKTFESDGSAWVAVGSAPGSVSLMAYDAARGVTVGLMGANTWTWDGASWKQLMVDGPTSARDSAMTYDARRERIVRFGGYKDGTGSSQIDETWEWDGSRWMLMSPVVRPSARGGHGMAFDSRRGQVVIYGGYRHNEVWEYDGTNWLQRVTPTAPPGSFGNGLVYDVERGRMVFYASEGTLWEYQPVGDACTSNDQCPTGACVDGVCCDRACTSSCEVCSSELGAAKTGICQVLPDAGPKCTSSDTGSGGADAGLLAGARPKGGCSVTSDGSRTRGPLAWVTGLGLAALALRRRRRATSCGEPRATVPQPR